MRYLQSVTFELDIDGEDTSVTVWGELTSGGSTRWGSDEPPWFDVEIEDIRYDDNSKVPDVVFNKIVDVYGEHISDTFERMYL